MARTWSSGGHHHKHQKPCFLAMLRRVSCKHRRVEYGSDCRDLEQREASIMSISSRAAKQHWPHLLKARICGDLEHREAKHRRGEHRSDCRVLEHWEASIRSISLLPAQMHQLSVRCIQPIKGLDVVQQCLPFPVSFCCTVRAVLKGLGHLITGWSVGS